MYSAPDFVKVEVKVDESFAKYNCTLVVGTEYLLNSCEAGSDFHSYIEVFPSSAFICYEGQNE